MIFLLCMFLTLSLTACNGTALGVFAQKIYELDNSAARGGVGTNWYIEGFYEC